MRTYVINLAGQHARRAHMQQMLSAHGLTAAWIDAVDGRQLDDAEMARWNRPRDLRKPLIPAQVGCFLSHRRCWQALVASNDPAAIVFEDDAFLAPDAEASLTDLSWLPRDAHFVRIETWRNRLVLDRRPVARAGGREVFRLRGTTFGCAGYIVSRAGAQLALAGSDPLPNTADDFLFNVAFAPARTFVTYHLVPSPCIQGGRMTPALPQFESSIRAPGPQKPLPLLAKVGREIRRVFVSGPGRAWLVVSTLARGRQWRIAEFG